MTDENENNDQGIERSDIEEEVLSDTQNMWETDSEPTGLGDINDAIESTTVVDELAARDDLDEDKAEALVDAGYDTPQIIIAAEMQDLLNVDGIGVNGAAAAIEWAEDNTVDNNTDDTDESEKSDTPDLSDIDTDPAIHAGRKVGVAAASVPLFIVTFFLNILKGVLKAVVSKVPKRTSIYRKMIKGGYQGIYKNTGAHVVANTIYGDGKMIPRKAKIDEETGHLETSNDEWWTTPGGLYPVMIGDARVVFGVADDHQLVDHIGARVSEAMDLGAQRRRNVTRTQSGVMPSEATNTAVADGGLSSTSTFDDIWLDVSNPEPSNDGMVVSLEKHYDAHFDQGSSEEMENQETRGMLAVMDPRNNKYQSLIYVLLFAGGIALGMFGPGLAAQLAGSAPSGGGSPVPVMLGVSEMWLR